MTAPRKKARERVHGFGHTEPGPDSLLRELRIHQIELEMQNQELQETNLGLERAARRYRELYDFAPVGYFTLDPDGKILEANLTVVDMLGRPRSEILGKNLYLMLPSADRDILYRHLRSVFQSGSGQTCELRLMSKGRGESYFQFQSHRHDDPEISRSCRSAAVDITAAKKTQEELSAANLLNESLVQSVAESLLVLDNRLCVVSGNTAFYKTFRLDPSLVEGKSVWLLSKERWYEPELRRRLEQLTMRGKSFDGLELVGEFPGIGRRELNIGARNLKNAADGTRRILLLIRDLTERRNTERQVQNTLLRLEEANHHLAQFASVVSHDLKNPLRTIADYAGFLAQDLAETLLEEHRGYLKGIQAAVHLAEEQVTGLLQLARIRESELECRRIRLRTMLAKVLDSAAGSKGAKIEFPDTWPTIVTEPTLLQQILRNLLDNAIKHNPSESRIIQLGWTRQERHVELFVRDNGPGIAPQQRENIFLAFRRLQANKTVEGSGLGLAIVRAAADRLGGAVRVESEIGKGSTFYVRLPVDGPHQPDR